LIKDRCSFGHYQIAALQLSAQRSTSVRHQMFSPVVNELVIVKPPKVREIGRLFGQGLAPECH
jgi:hypothetical protein